MPADTPDPKRGPIPMLQRFFVPLAMALGISLAASLAAGLPAAAQTSPAAPPVAGPPACIGRDLLADLRDRSPQERQRIDEVAAATANAGALLWRIEKPGVAPSHLFGTVHLSDDRVNALPPSVEQALGGAQRLALEIADLSPAALGAAIGRVQGLLVYRDGRSLEQALSEPERALARRIIEAAGMPGAALATLKPWVVTMTMSLSDCERRRVATGLKALDQRLGEKAKARGIPVLGLETIEDQLKALAAVSDDHQMALLRAGLKLYPQTADMIETMVQRYLRRELGLIWPLQEQLWRDVGLPPSAAASFRRELLEVRNRHMRDAALPLIAKGGSFIAVGALHLPGTDGLVALLAQAGYTVTPVP